MSSSATARNSAERRGRLSRRLAEAGLIPGPRRLASFDDRSGVLGTDRLGEILAELGAPFAAFGLYLARRCDLLPGPVCFALASICDRGEALPATTVEELLAGALGAGGPLASFVAEPARVGLLYQEHWATARDGQPLLVRLARHGEPDLEATLHDLDALAPVLGIDRGRFSALFADYRRALDCWSDLRGQAERLERLHHELMDEGPVVVPRLVAGSATRRRMVVEWPGRCEPAAIGGAPAERGLERRVASAWLEVALVAGRLPVEAAMWPLEDGRIVMLPGEMAALKPEVRTTLWNYLRASAEERPDRAAEWLLPAVEEADAGRATELERRLRQIVPFRDGRWSRDGSTLAEHLALHWRCVTEVGLKPRPYLLAFYRGLFSLVGREGQRSPQEDPLREAVVDLRWRAGWRGWRRRAAPEALRRSAESNLLGLLELPDNLDRLLDLADGVGADSPLDGLIAPPLAGRRGRWSTQLALGLALVAVCLAAVRLSALDLPRSIVEISSALVFIGLALLWLRTTTRR